MKNITLKESLQKRSMHFLKDIASAWKVKGYTKMKKDELVDACAETIQRDGIFEEHAFILSPKAWAFYKKVANSEDGICTKAEQLEYVISEHLGFLYSEKRDDGYWFAIPDEIKQIYDRLMSEGFSQIKDFADLVHQYAQAAVNLYGVISQEELVRIFNTQNEDQTNIDLNFAVFIKHIYIDADYCLWEEYIVHKDLEENDFESAKELIRDAGDKPRYIPQKAEFLHYSDWAYYENTKQLIDLSRFLLDKCGVSDNNINQLMYDFQWNFAQEESIQEHFDLLENNGIILDENQVNEFIRHIIECANNTRLWVNKVHTPNELVKFYKNPIQRKIQKIGRNDPCPCGSGKKYKKCCGK